MAWISFSAVAILNALNSKGLRHPRKFLFPGQCRNIECPEFKGIKTAFLRVVFSLAGNIECPEFKGIKTVVRRALVPGDVQY